MTLLEQIQMSGVSYGICKDGSTFAMVGDEITELSDTTVVEDLILRREQEEKRWHRLGCWASFVATRREQERASVSCET